MRVRRALHACHGMGRSDLVREFVRHDLPDRIEDVEVWGMAAANLVGHGSDELVIRRMLSDYRRSDAEPWALCNLSLALLYTGRLRELEEVSGFACTLPRDHSYFGHRTLLAYCRLKQGRLEECRDLLAAPPQSMAFARALLAEVRFLLRCAERPSRGELFVACRTAIAEVLPAIREMEEQGGLPVRTSIYREWRRATLASLYPPALLLWFGSLGRALLRMLLVRE